MAHSNPERLSQDQVFDILSNQRRRYALHYLSGTQDGVSHQTLARQIAAWENEIPVESVSKQQQKRVYVSLYQTHIPKLESIGVVEYDSDTGMITLTNRADEVTTYLRVNGGNEGRWHLYYLGLVSISTIVFVATVLNVWPLSVVPLSVVGLVIMFAFGLLSIGYFLQRYRRTNARVEQRRNVL